MTNDIEPKPESEFTIPGPCSGCLSGCSIACNSAILRIRPEFKIGQVVYVHTDPDQRKMMVTGIVVRKNRTSYMVSFIDVENEYEPFEIAAVPNFKQKMGL